MDDTAPVRENISGIGELLGNTLSVFKQRVLTLGLIYLATVLLALVAMAIPLTIGFLLGAVVPVLTPIAFVVGIIAAVYTLSWGMASLVAAVIDGSSGVKASFSLGKPHILAYLWTSVLMGVLITGAELLLIIPGIIFAVWFMFGLFVVVDEGFSGLDALLRSKEYVRGRWFALFIRILVVTIVAAIISIIPVIGAIVAVPFLLIAVFLLYRELKEIKGTGAFIPSGKTKAGIVAVGLAGPAVATAFVIITMGAAVMPFLLGLQDKIPGMGGNEEYTFEQRGANITSKIDLDEAKMKAPPPPPPKKKKPAAVVIPPAPEKVAKAEPGELAMPEIEIEPAEPGELVIPEYEPGEPEELAMPEIEPGEPVKKAKLPPRKKYVYNFEREIGTLKNEGKGWLARTEAARNLGKARETRAVDALIHYLSTDTETYVRREAAIALGRIGDKRAEEPLAAAVADYDQWVGIFSAEALKELKGTGRRPVKRKRKETALRTVPAGVGPWAVHVGSYLSKDKAEEVNSTLAGSGYHAYTTRFTLRGTLWHRVRVGFYDSRADVTKAMGEIAGRIKTAEPWAVRPSKREISKNR